MIGVTSKIKGQVKKRILQKERTSSGRGRVQKQKRIGRYQVMLSWLYLAIISFSLLDECPPLPKTLAGVDRK